MTRPSPKHIQPSKHRKLLAEEDRAPSLRPFGSVRPPKEKGIFSFLLPFRDGVRLKWASSASAIAFAFYL